MTDQLIHLDRELFMALNGFHAAWLDPVFYTLTNTLAWLPLYLVFVYWIWKKYKGDSWIFIIGLALTILIADRFTTGLMKPFFLRLRPTHDPLLQDSVHTVNNYVGGEYGFASSHAANTFGAATFIFVMLKDSRKYMWTIFLWCSFVGYTRIYLGVHFPGDIIVGAMIGVLSALMNYWLCTKFWSFRKANQPSG
jgi:undecaprenyl-diphosphatase